MSVFLLHVPALYLHCLHRALEAAVYVFKVVFKVLVIVYREFSVIRAVGKTSVRTDLSFLWSVKMVMMGVCSV